MSHEIYYTSAPEGIKRGTSGFCTVAASENIPKALWDRLETLSAYRHQFGSGGQPNPVSCAHWILVIAGKSHHVLSRICDSGVDHTQRTNAFAHHLVLDPTEMAAAAGGPAWLLEQPGVMMERWDGQVGSLQPSRLAQGDIPSSSRICRAWEAVTGDAGWGGHLADLFAKAPTRPVCILFEPGQDLLPLLAESIALLPPAARWNITFNTYFTSMPTSATCLWRCCLAGTPAAQTGLRYAANGLVLDLTDRARLPALSPGDYVTLARTGQSAAALRPAAAKAVQPGLAEPRKNAPAGKTKPSAPAPIYDPEGDEEERAAERRRDNFFDFVAPPAEADTASAGSGTYDLRAGDATSDAPPKPGPQRTWPPGAPPRPFRRAEEALEDAERDAQQAAQRRRRQVLLLFVGALAAIAIGSGLVFFLGRSGAPPEPTGTAAALHPRPVESAPVLALPDTVPATEPLATDNVPGTATTTVVQTPPVATTPEIVTTAAVYPDLLTLTGPIEHPNVGTGIGDRTQSLGFRAADLDPLAVTGVRLAFFYAQADKLASPPSPQAPAIYKNNTLGTLSAVSRAVGTRKGVAIYWKPASDPGLGTEMLFIAFDHARPGIELQWHAPALLRNPAVYNFLFWTLQNSALILDGARATPQQIVTKPFAPGPINFTDPTFELTWPAELPRDVRAVEPTQEALPPGWKADWYLDWDPGVAATARTTDNANQVISFKKAGSNPKIEAWFLLTFKPGNAGGIAKVECTFARRFQQDQDDLARAEKDLADITKKIDDLRHDPALSTFGGGVPGDMLTKQNDAQAAAEAYKAAVAGYNELMQFDVTFDLSDKMRLATLHFQRPRAFETGK